MGEYRLNKSERETILLTSEADDTWSIYTFNTDLKNRLWKFAAHHPEIRELKDDDIGLCDLYRVKITIVDPLNFTI